MATALLAKYTTIGHLGIAITYLRIFMIAVPPRRSGLTH